MKEYDRQLQPELQSLMRAIDDCHRVLDERERVVAWIRKEVEAFGGRIKDVFVDAVTAEFEAFPVGLCDRIVRERRVSWQLDDTELVVWLKEGRRA